MSSVVVCSCNFFLALRANLFVNWICQANYCVCTMVCHSITHSMINALILCDVLGVFQIFKEHSQRPSHLHSSQIFIIVDVVILSPSSFKKDEIFTLHYIFEWVFFWYHCYSRWGASWASIMWVGFTHCLYFWVPLKLNTKAQSLSCSTQHGSRVDQSRRSIKWNEKGVHYDELRKWIVENLDFYRTTLVLHTNFERKYARTIEFHYVVIKALFPQNMSKLMSQFGMRILGR